jgi:alkyldihydroxyacetonephosphate synthase
MSWKAFVTTISEGALADAEAALTSALGEGAVITAAEALDAYTADTYWPALHAKAAGTPIARPDVVVRPRTEEDVATVLAIASERRVPVVPWGGGSGTQGGALPINGGIVIDLRSLDEVIAIDETSMTVTVQAGKNGRELEAELNARRLMLPHYPASVEWATVGGYIAARGSGVLSTRYGKIEDLVLSLRVATPAGGLMETIEVPRHAMGPELTQLFVGSEGTLGVITRATLQLVPLPAARRFAAVAFPSVGTGIAALRHTLQVGHRPSVIRMYDEEATRLTFAPVVGEDLSGVYTVLAFEGEEEAAELEERRTLAIATEAGAEVLDPALGQRWWDRRYDFYHPPHQPELPAIWGTLDVVATYSRVQGVYDALAAAVREPYRDTGLQLRMHFSHWYLWGTMIYGRFVVPDGGPDALALHDRIWEDGMTAALDAGAVINDHHGVGIKLGPYMQRQHGVALDSIRRIKTALDPHDVMNPGKLGL